MNKDDFKKYLNQKENGSKFYLDQSVYLEWSTGLFHEDFMFVFVKIGLDKYVKKLSNVEKGINHIIAQVAIFIETTYQKYAARIVRNL